LRFLKLQHSNFCSIIKGIIRHISINDLPVGRSVDEIVRLVSAFQHTDEFGELCPANWQPGDPTIQTNPSPGTDHSLVTSSSDVNYTRVKLNNNKVPTRWSGGDNHFTSSACTSKNYFAQTLCRLQDIVTEGLDAYKAALQTAPLQTKALSSMVIALLGELIAASIKAQRSKSKKSELNPLYILSI
jgi:hypothetical protein